MNAARCIVPLRGGAIEVFYRENGPHADWWFAHNLGRITADEEQQIQAVVDHELKVLREDWNAQRFTIVESARAGRPTVQQFAALKQALLHAYPVVAHRS